MITTEYMINGGQLKCANCGHTEFVKKYPLGEDASFSAYECTRCYFAFFSPTGNKMPESSDTAIPRLPGHLLSPSVHA